MGPWRDGGTPRDVVLAVGLLALTLILPRAGAPGEPPPALPARRVVDVRALPPLLAGEGAARAVPFRSPRPELRRSDREPGSGAPPSPGATQSITPPPGPTILRGFIGMGLPDTCRCIPPDTQVAAGPQHLVEVVNGAGRIMTRDGVPLFTFGLNRYFGLDPAAHTFDPRIRFDVLSNRWFVSMAEDSSTSGAWHLAVSQTSDPTGLYVAYTFASSPNTVPDFPGLGIGDDKVVLTGNAFQCLATCDGAFVGAEFLVLRKEDLLAGAAAPASQLFPPDPGFPTIQPAHSVSPGPTLFMVANDAADPTTTVKVWALTGAPPDVAVSSTVVAISPLGIPDRGVQPTGAVGIDTGDNRFLDANLRDGVLWAAANAACDPGAPFGRRGACMRFMRFRTPGPTLDRDLTFGAPGVSYYHPAIQTDALGSLVTAFSGSSASEFASVHVSALPAGDPPGALQPPVLVKAGENVYDPLAAGLPATRWGDYSAAAVDPSDPTTVWIAGEYARVEGGAAWGTWIAQVRAPALTLALATNAEGYRAGDRAVVSATLANAGPAVTADVFLGAVLPPAAGPALGCPAGDAVAFVEPGRSALSVRCLSSSPASFPAFARDVGIPTALPPTAAPGVLDFAWSDATPGPYTFFIALVRPGAFLDGRVDPGDVLVVAGRTVLFTPW